MGQQRGLQIVSWWSPYARSRSSKWHTLWCSKVDNVSVSLEHVDLLNGLDRLNIQLLQCSLQLLVIHARALVDLLLLSSRCTLSTVKPRQLMNIPPSPHS